jgi:hypothetical protein
MTDPELSIPIMSPERCDEGTIFTPEEVLARLDAKAKLTAHELGDAPDEARAMAATVRTLLSALSRGEGWVLVPREPTEAMQEAGGRSIAHPSVYMGGAGPNRRKLAAQYYRAMIAAAPPVPEGEE